MKFLQDRLSLSALTLEKFKVNSSKTINSLFLSVEKALNEGGKIILIGNGGSFSIAQHISAEFTGRFIRERKSLPSIVLGSNTASFSAISNDYGYENSFSRELTSLGESQDVLISMSFLVQVKILLML